MKNAFNNFSNRQLTMIISLIVTIVSCFIVFVFMSLKNSSISLIAILFSLLSGTFLSYFLIHLILEKYVYSKINVIYKFINSSTDKNIKEETPNPINRSLDMVNVEVAEWAAGKDKEIDSLKSLAEYRKSFVGNISHELKTPIFTLQGYIHTLLDGGLYDPKINVKYLERAALGIERLQNIVDDLEIIAKLESGQIELNPTNFDILKLTREIFDGLELLAEKKNIKFSIGPNILNNNIVRADRQGIYQVMNNLIMNSIKYGKEGGFTKVDFFDMDSNILLEVSDDGIGINKEHIKHLFDRFYRVDPSRSRQQGGSGLGLSIVKHIVEAHKGKITVRSTPDAGSTFGFTLKKPK